VLLLKLVEFGKKRLNESLDINDKSIIHCFNTLCNRGVI